MAPVLARLLYRAVPLLVACVGAAGTGSSLAQLTSISNDEAPAASSLGAPVRSVRVAGRFAAAIPLPEYRCQRLDDTLQSALMGAVRPAFRVPDEELLGVGRRGMAQVLYIGWRETPVPAPNECGNEPAVDVELRPYRVRISNERLGENLLPIARDALGIAEPHAPAWMKATRTEPALRYDRAQGTVLGLSLDAALAEWLEGAEAHASLAKATGAPFHDGVASLRWRKPQRTGLVAEQRLNLQAVRQRQPLGEDTLSTEASGLGMGLTLRFSPRARVALDAAWQDRRTQLGLSAPEVQSSRWSERVMADLLHPQSLSFVRGALWLEHGGGRQRAAAAAGAAREVRLAPGRLIGMEAQLTFGQAARSSTPQEQFRGGAWPAQFLYDGTLAPALLQMPEGPLLRSAGRAQAQLAAPARGGTRFQGLSINLAAPVQRWYRPLIPDEVDDTSDPPVTLKQRLMKQVDVTAVSMLAGKLTQEGRSPEAALAEARAMIGEVQPAVRFLVEDAAMFALRPLVMLDAAQLSDGAARARWSAAGLGLQLQMTSARAELGYMRQVEGPKTGERGSLVFRLVFQNLI